MYKYMFYNMQLIKYIYYYIIYKGIRIKDIRCIKGREERRI